MKRSFAAFGLLLVVFVVAAPPDAKPPSEAPTSKRERWRQYLKVTDYQFRPEEASAVYSFGQYTAATRLQMIFDSKDRWRELAFRFGKDGELLELHGFPASVFKERNNVLYFIPNIGFGGSMGCTVSAYDLHTGKLLWETPLQILELAAHSAYSNEINLDVIQPYGTDTAVCVTGHESFGDYRAILDPDTGEVLARQVVHGR